MKLKEYKYRINGIKFNVGVGDVVDNKVHVEVNGTPYDVELENAPAVKPSVIPAAKKPQTAPTTSTGEKVISKPAAAPGKASAVLSPLPGTITKINVTVGQQVNVGDTVCMLEAMKMENDIHTQKGGVVKQILVSVGDTILEGGQIMIIE